jgi:hemerythrin-like domain-containing protein
MLPTDLLSHDHRVIERVLTALETAAGRLREGAAVPPAFFLGVADLIKGFADGCHHRKEEEHLFPAMEEAGFPRSGGPIGVMLAEHDDGRRYTAGLRKAAERLAGGDASAAAAVVENAEAYAGLLRQHILKEDNVLFVMAKRALSPEKLDELTAAFEQVEREEGSHDRWLGEVEKLERQALGAGATQ